MTKWLLWLVVVNILTVWTPLVSETAVDKPFDYLAGVQSDDASLCMVYASATALDSPIVLFADGQDLLKKICGYILVGMVHEHTLRMGMRKNLGRGY